MPYRPVTEEMIRFRAKGHFLMMVQWQLMAPNRHSPRRSEMTAIEGQADYERTWPRQPFLTQLGHHPLAGLVPRANTAGLRIVTTPPVVRTLAASTIAA